MLFFGKDHYIKFSCLHVMCQFCMLCFNMSTFYNYYLGKNLTARMNRGLMVYGVWNEGDIQPAFYKHHFVYGWCSSVHVHAWQQTLY